jgi:peptidoglycan hydrolase-like protein with peptidoglycan-binding domain
VKQDGVIGPITRRAVQEKLGVKPDGKWGRITISELQRSLNIGRI